MDWRSIPSLAALRAFEATARRASFSAAARELNVTHAAIAQHVRALEADLATPLVMRSGQGMGLTPEGAQLAAQLGDAFGTIAGAVDALRRAQQDLPLRISLTPSFAESWLMPRLGGFWQAHPDIKLTLNPTMDLADLRRDGIDLAIRFGMGDWPGVHVQKFLGAPYVVVASPDLAKGARHLSDLGDPAHQQWFFAVAAREQRIWGASLGIDFDQVPFFDLQSNTLVHAAVRSGYGLSIQARSLVERDLQTGQMVALHQGDSAGLEYYIVTPGPDLAPKAKHFSAWLKSQADQE
ncbi:MAG: LysR family transcriptional regulator [Rhodobacteraceae bacterium]|nr:LysR family transcriptional regulator [Paracoccaceae bacterium]